MIMNVEQTLSPLADRELAANGHGARAAAGTPEPVVSVAAAAPKVERLMSLDAYRGFVMLLMISSGFGIVEVSRTFADSGWWRFLAYETDHAPWRGCTLWDLIQPS